MKRTYGGAFLIVLLLVVTASVCFADNAGPRWPPVRVESTMLNR